MSITVGGNLALGFESTLKQHVYTMQVHALPQVEWTWRFSALAGGETVGVRLNIPSETSDPFAGWGMAGKEFNTEIPADVDAAHGKFSDWFAGIHGQFRKNNMRGHSSPDDEATLSLIRDQ